MITIGKQRSEGFVALRDGQYFGIEQRFGQDIKDKYGPIEEAFLFSEASPGEHAQSPLLKGAVFMAYRRTVTHELKEPELIITPAMRKKVAELKAIQIPINGGLEDVTLSVGDLITFFVRHDIKQLPIGYAVGTYEDFSKDDTWSLEFFLRDQLAGGKEFPPGWPYLPQNRAQASDDLVKALLGTGAFELCLSNTVTFNTPFRHKTRQYEHPVQCIQLKEDMLDEKPESINAVGKETHRVAVEVKGDTRLVEKAVIIFSGAEYDQESIHQIHRRFDTYPLAPGFTFGITKTTYALGRVDADGKVCGDDLKDVNWEITYSNRTVDAMDVAPQSLPQYLTHAQISALAKEPTAKVLATMIPIHHFTRTPQEELMNPNDLEEPEDGLSLDEQLHRESQDEDAASIRATEEAEERLREGGGRDN